MKTEQVEDNCGSSVNRDTRILVKVQFESVEEARGMEHVASVRNIVDGQTNSSQRC